MSATTAAARSIPLTGKEEPNGTSIVDVTDPKNPKYLAHIPGQPVGGRPNMPGMSESGGAQMARVCSGAELPRADKSKFYLLRAYGNTAGSAPRNVGRDRSGQADAAST